MKGLTGGKHLLLDHADNHADHGDKEDEPAEGAQRDDGAQIQFGALCLAFRIVFDDERDVNVW